MVNGKPGYRGLTPFPSGVSTVESVKTAVREPAGLSNRSPSLIISWDPAKLHITSEEVAKNWPETNRGSRSAQERRRWTWGQGSRFHKVRDFDHALDDAGRGRQNRGRQDSWRTFREAQSETGMTAPAANISGRWNVNVEFFSSKSQHTLYYRAEWQPAPGLAQR